MCVWGEGVGERESEIDREPVLAQLAIFMQFYITSLVVKVRDHDFDDLRVCEPLYLAQLLNLVRLPCYIASYASPAALRRKCTHFSVMYT